MFLLVVVASSAVLVQRRDYTGTETGLLRFTIRCEYWWNGDHFPWCSIRMVRFLMMKMAWNNGRHSTNFHI